MFDEDSFDTDSFDTDSFLFDITIVVSVPSENTAGGGGGGGKKIQMRNVRIANARRDKLKAQVSQFLREEEELLAIIVNLGEELI